VVEIRRITVWDGGVRGTKKLWAHSDETEIPLGADREPEPDPPPGFAAAEWLEEKDWAAAEASGGQLLDALDHVLLHLEGIFVRRLHEFLTYEDLSQRLRKHRKTRIKAIAQSAEDTNALRDMFKALLAERTPITEFDVLCDVFLESPDRDSPAVIARMRMAPEVRCQLWGNAGGFTLLSTGPGFERLINEGVKHAEEWQWPVLALQPSEHSRAMAAVRDGLQDIVQPAIVVSDPILRPHVRKLIDHGFPEIPVLAKEELMSEARIDSSRLIEL
jgi:flagellar biosynthesis component FlhA